MVKISSACPRAGLRAPRTMVEAFGPHAYLTITTRMSVRERIDRFALRTAVAGLAAVYAAIGWRYWA